MASEREITAAVQAINAIWHQSGQPGQHLPVRKIALVALDAAARERDKARREAEQHAAK